MAQERFPAATPHEQKGEIMNQIIIPEIDTKTQATFINRPEGLLICGCGDDRACSSGSGKQIEKDFGANAKGAILRYFGGGLGAARIMLVTLAAQHGPEGLSGFAGRNIFDITADLARRAREASGVVFALHSSTGSEGQDTGLNLHSKNPLACAYAGSLGGVSTGAFSDVVLQASLAEGPSLFGPAGKPESWYRLAEANRLFVSTTLDGRQDFNSTRTDFVRAGAPVMLLLGSHTNSSNTKSVTNFKSDKISSPDLAHAQDMPFYDNDVTQVAEAIIKSYPEYKFDPLTMLMAMDLDIRSTRAALAGGDPLGLKLERWGDAAEALDYLNSL
ncbi:MAG TPA: hypothetical protein VFP35_00410 [Candidatus Saccharimonadales bacterium]|nr:hypothetical protein [Candidatus Saccharimonadales bacterium]